MNISRTIDHDPTIFALEGRKNSIINQGRNIYLPHTEIMNQQYDHITIGIIARNEEETLPITLSYLLKQTYPLEYVEIIIADGNSDDNTREVAASFLKSKNIKHKTFNERDFSDLVGVGYGHSRGRNVILMNKSEQSKYVAWIDADCRANKDWLMNLWNTIKNNNDSKIAGAGGTRFVETQGDDISPMELVLNYYFTSNIISLGNPAFTPKDNITYIPSVAGYNSIFKAEIFDTYQYDTTYPFNTDDLEMNFRLSKHGYKFLYAKDAIIYHRGEDTIRGFLKQMQNYGRGVAYTMKIHKTPFVRLYAWIAVGYLCYTICLPLLMYMSYQLMGCSLYPLLPYIVLAVLGLFVCMENMKMTRSLQSIIILPLVFMHLFVYGYGLLREMVRKGYFF